MDEKVAAFDIEIATDIPQGEDWHKLAPIGITCAAVLLSDDKDPYLFSGRDKSPRMEKLDARYLVSWLHNRELEGYKIVTWNGLGFDFEVLAVESGLKAMCADMALNHIDMMFHFFCANGFPVGLNAVALEMGTEHKTEGMHGDLAPAMWREGKQDEVLKYVAQDVVTTMAVYNACKQRGAVAWKTRTGKSRAWQLPKEGWLSAREALLLPPPDNSWMDNPWPRTKFMGWTA